MFSIFVGTLCVLVTATLIICMCGNASGDWNFPIPLCVSLPILLLLLSIIISAIITWCLNDAYPP